MTDCIDSEFYGNKFKYYHNVFKILLYFEVWFMIFTLICGYYKTLNSEFYMMIFFIYTFFKILFQHHMKGFSYFYQILLLENRDIYD